MQNNELTGTISDESKEVAPELPLRYEDWSTLINSKLLERAYQRYGYDFPQDGPTIIKIFPEKTGDVHSLLEWYTANQMPFDEEGQPIHLDIGRLGRREGDENNAHIDLLGEHIGKVGQQKVLAGELVRERLESHTKRKVEPRFRLSRKGVEKLS